MFIRICWRNVCSHWILSIFSWSPFLICQLRFNTWHQLYTTVLRHDQGSSTENDQNNYSKLFFSPGIHYLGIDVRYLQSVLTLLWRNKSVWCICCWPNLEAVWQIIASPKRKLQSIPKLRKVSLHHKVIEFQTKYHTCHGIPVFMYCSSNLVCITVASSNVAGEGTRENGCLKACKGIYIEINRHFYWSL